VLDALARALAPAVLALAAWLFPAVARAIEVKQTVWGFDGQVVSQRFNLFSALADNPTASPYEGTMQLRKISFGKQVDAVIVEPIYLSPYSSRWVQFYPYIASDFDNWELSWGAGAANSLSPPVPRLGKPAAVLLEDPDAGSRSAGAIKRLPDNLFPAHATATDCLAAVVLDHVPRWDTARQRSFLEWLRRGGRTYLLRSSVDGKFPEFAGELQSVSSSNEKARVGSGYVYRLERNVRQLDISFVERVLVAGVEPGAEVAEEIARKATGATGSQVGAAQGFQAEDGMGNNQEGFDYRFSASRWEVEETLLTRLKTLSDPDHSWFLIHILALVYLGTIGPGCYAIGRMCGGDFRKTFGFLLAAIGLFSIAFLFVGRRGYHEATQAHAVAIARQDAPGRFDVTQWSNAFVVQGGDYSLTHAGSSRIYSSCQDQEAVRGEIRNGPDAHFLADMPPFSSRSFAHRALVDAPPIAVEIEEWLTAQDQSPVNMTVRDMSLPPALRVQRILAKFKLRKGPNFPAVNRGLWALYGHRLYRLKDSGEQLELTAENRPLRDLIRTDKYNRYSLAFDPMAQQVQWPAVKPEPTTLDVFDNLFFPLLTRSLDLADQRAVESFSLPTDRVRLFVYAPMPSGLFLKDARFAVQQGFVLFSLDIFEPEPR